MPLQLDLNGFPGVPRGLAGFVEADVPVASPGGTSCRAPARHPSRDVLRGPPGDLLGGPPEHDLLRGPAPGAHLDAQ
jgi:hypothetical protein